MGKFMILVVLVLGACGTSDLPDAPIVRTVFDETVSENDREYARRSWVPWMEFGFTFEESGYTDAVEDQRLPECDISWELTTPDCFITIIVAKEDVLGLGSADIDRRIIYLDIDLHGYNLFAAGAHEYGHVILNASHLPEGQVGIMRDILYTPTKITADDIAFVCSSVEICI